MLIYTVSFTYHVIGPVSELSQITSCLLWSGIGCTLNVS